VTGAIETGVGPVATVRTTWSRRDRRGAVACRISDRFRMRYRVAPGLYAAGRPDEQSPVFVSANYKLSFDHLRRALSGIDGWISTGASSAGPAP
jgi:acetyl-CoA decarbonylase/synthase complex subunit gamma